MNTASSESSIWVVESPDELDELYSNLLYMPSRVAITPDGRLWELWAEPGSEGLVLRHLHRGIGDLIVTTSFAHAFTVLAGASVLEPEL